jgi:hypothetical protein
MFSLYSKVKHGLETAHRDVTVRLAVHSVTDSHVIGGNRLRDCARSGSCAEKPPRDFLPGTDLSDRAVPARIKIDSQRLL